MSSPDKSTNDFQSLSHVLRGRRTAALIAEAELIRDAPMGTDRDDEAHRYVREAMLLFALRKITRAERDRILDILAFAIPAASPQTEPPASADIDSPTPRDPFG